MEKKKLIRFIFFVLPLTLIFLACGGGGGDDGEDGGAVSRGITKVSSNGDAYQVIQDIEGKSIEEATINLNTGSHTNKIVNGVSGTASITGTKSSTSSSSSNCIYRTNSIDVTIVFNNYLVKVGNTEITVNGTVSYYDYHHSSQCGLNYSSNCSSTMKSTTPVKIRIVYNMTSGIEGYDDTISFYGSSSSCTSTLKGTLTASNGTTYSF